MKGELSGKEVEISGMIFELHSTHNSISPEEFYYILKFIRYSEK